MPNALTPAFANVSTFGDFVDAYRANPCERGNVTRNDLVRAWNILSTLRNQASTFVTLRYADINISQSSVRTIVSKLNTLFRHIGLLTPSQGIRIEYSDFFHANIACADLDISGLGWHLGHLADTRGRRQDRVNTRHQNGHRSRRNGTNAPLFPTTAVSYPATSAMVSSDNIANLTALVDSFNAFEGITSEIILALEADAD